MHFVKAHIRIYRIPAPARLIIGMHGDAGISRIFQIRNDGRGPVRDILLVHHRTAGKERHGIPRQKLPLGVWRLRTEYGGYRVSFDRIFSQRIVKRRRIRICLEISDHSQIGIRLAHHNNNRRIRLPRSAAVHAGCFLYVLGLPVSVLLFKLRDRLRGIPLRLRDKTIPDAQQKIEHIAVPVAAFLLPCLRHDIFRLFSDIKPAENCQGYDQHRHRKPSAK